MQSGLVFVMGGMTTWTMIEMAAAAPSVENAQRGMTTASRRRKNNAGVGVCVVSLKKKTPVGDRPHLCVSNLATLLKNLLGMLIDIVPGAMMNPALQVSLNLEFVHLMKRIQKIIVVIKILIFYVRLSISNKK